MASREVTIFQIKISLLNTDPLVWRRLEVPSNISLNNFTFNIIRAMGWNFTHLYCYRINDEDYGDLERDYEQGWLDDRKIKVFQAAEKSRSFQFIYDFGDNWIHEIKVEKEKLADPKEKYPKLIDGENACPPEDCGGTHGFQELKEALADPRHERHKELRDWCGEYNPKQFDPKFQNFCLIQAKIPKNLRIRTEPLSKAL